MMIHPEMTNALTISTLIFHTEVHQNIPCPLGRDGGHAKLHADKQLGPVEHLAPPRGEDRPVHDLLDVLEELRLGRAGVTAEEHVEVAPDLKVRNHCTVKCLKTSQLEGAEGKIHISS